jgi:quercetin dioxygenase-like cupin family protein
MNNNDIKKAEVQNISSIIEYIPDSVVIRSIIQKSTGRITAAAFDSGEEIIGKISRFDTLIQIIDGNAEIVIDDKSNLLKTGQFIIIPANSRNMTRANVKFKMLSTVIKSGYEEVS